MKLDTNKKSNSIETIAPTKVVKAGSILMPAKKRAVSLKPSRSMKGMRSLKPRAFGVSVTKKD
ncbi:MAG: hypothetical protein GY909_03735 [Oligoflexia bacterium]|nr:hypothetical protein [Oligoflexia bacterium]